MAGPRNMDIPDDKPLESAVESRTFAHKGLPVQKGSLAAQKPREGPPPKKKAVCSASTSQSHSNFSMFEIRISSFNFDSSLGTRLQIQ
jgi:hypothetical protein